MSTKWSVTFDCAHPAEVARFWARALGYVEPPPPSGFATWEEWLTHFGVPEEEWDDGAYLHDPDGDGPTLSFLKVPEGKVVKNRVHLDIRASEGRETPVEVRWPLVQAKVRDLVAAGGTVLREDAIDGVPDHVVMADPEGNEFCVI
ncbi:VOC family protein [Actinosynnema sp. CA-248983]